MYLILNGITQKGVSSKKINIKTIVLISVKYQNNNHSNPPLSPSDYNLKRENFICSYNYFLSIQKNLISFKKFEFVYHTIDTNPVINKRFHERCQLARAPP
jgi:hypothetical protein